MGHLHYRGYIYRDLKSENILIGKDGYISLSDFGLCKKLHHDDLAYSYVGSKHYMAPEIILESGHDRMADWWSLGILMYLRILN